MPLCLLQAFCDKADALRLAIYEDKRVRLQCGTATDMTDMIPPPLATAEAMADILLREFPAKSPPLLIHGQPCQATASEIATEHLQGAMRGVRVEVSASMPRNTPPDNHTLLPGHRYTTGDLLTRLAAESVICDALAMYSKKLTLRISRNLTSREHTPRGWFTHPFCVDSLPIEIGEAVADFMVERFAKPCKVEMCGVLLRLHAADITNARTTGMRSIEVAIDYA